MKFARLLSAAVFFLAACSSDLPHEAPYDAQSPLDKQAKASLSGRITLQGESDYSQVTVELQSAARTYNTDTKADGTVRLTGIVPGAYTLSIRTRYFKAVTETVTVALGEEVRLGTRNLAALTSNVSGAATLQTVDNNKLVTTGGVTLILTKTASARGAKAAPRAFAAAAEVTAETYRTVSGSDGSYEFRDIAAGAYTLSASSRETGESDVGDVTVTGEGDITVDPIVLQPLTGFFTITGKIKKPDGSLQNSTVYTAVPQVALQLSGFNAAKMKIVESSDGQPTGCNLTSAPSLVFDGNYALTLSSEGVKLVCVAFLDADGKQTDPLYGSITYDATPPTPVNVALSASSGYTNQDSVLASVSAADALSGVATMVTSATAAGITAGTHTPFQSTIIIPFFTSTDGLKDTYVRVYDAAGNASVIKHVSVTVDRQAPAQSGAAALTSLLGAPIAGGDIVTARDLLYVSNVADANTLEMRVTTNGSFAGIGWEPYSASKALSLAPPASTSLDGESRTIAAEVRDAAGNVSSLAPAITVTLDTIAPSNPAVSIAAAATVSDTTVDVTLSASGSPVSAELAFDPGFLTSLGSFTPSGTHTITLPAGDGLKTVYARFFDAAGNESPTAGDTVVLDATPPSEAAFSIAATSPTKTNPVTLAYFATGAAEFRVTEDAASCGGPREAYGNGAKTFTLSGAEGLKTVRLQFFDAVGNASACLAKQVYFDPNAPVVGAFQINYGQAATSSNTVTINFVGVSGATKVLVSEDPGFSGADWQSYASAKTFVLSQGNGVKTVYAKVSDDAGNVVPLSSQTITIDNSPTSTPSIIASVDVTSATSVTLLLTAGLVSDMMLSQDDPTFATASWEPYAGSKVFPLTGTDGTKTIYAKFRKATLVETSVVSDTVILDRTGPILPSVRVNNGASVVSSNIVTLNLSAVDTASGVSTYKINTTNSFAVSEKSYQVNDLYSLLPGDGAKTLWVIFGDRAGNYSSPASVTVLLDSTPPAVNSVALKKLDGTAISSGAMVNDGRIVLDSSVTDVSPLEMQVSTTGSFASMGWEPYNSSKVIDLTSTSSTLSVRVRDGAGLITTLLSGFIVNLDRTAPVLSLSRLSSGATNNLTVGLVLSANETSESQVSESANFTGAAWFPTANTTITLAAGDGLHTVYARARDAAGNVSTIVALTVVLDSVAPVVTRVSLETGAYSPTPDVEIVVLATGADLMKLGTSADLSAVAAIPYASETIFTVSGGDGVKTIYVQLLDSAGNTSAAYPLTVTLDTAAPSLASVAINTGATYAVNRSIKIDLTDDASASEMQVDEDPLFGGSSWQSYKPTVSYTLNSVNDGVKPIYVRLRDLAGNVSAVRTDTINLDTTAPGDVFLVKRDAPKDYATGTAVIMRVNATGADYMQLSTDGTFTAGSWAPFATTATATVVSGDGLKNVWVQFKDAAGNLSQIGQTSFFLDTAAPEAGTLAFAQGAATNTRDVFLLLSASGADFYQIGTDSLTLAAQPTQPLQPGRPVQLADADGSQTYYVRYLDRAGNASATVSASILLDRVAPVAGPWSVLVNGGAATTRQAIVSLAFAATGATEMQVRNDAYFDGAAWEPVTSSTTWFLNQGDGVKQIYVRFRDDAGNITPAYWAQIKLDTTPPDVSRVVLNGNAEYANSSALQLQSEVKNAADFAEMQYGTDASFATGSGWITFAQLVTVNVAAGDGTKTLYVQFRDAAGNTSAVYSDSIALDQTPPATANINLNSGAAYANDVAGQVQLVLSATDALSGIADMQLSNSSSFAAVPTVPFYSPRWWTLDTSGGDGLKSVYVRFRDRAGNYSAAVSDTILLDRAAPSGASVTVAKSGGYVTSNVVNVTLTATDANGVKEVMLGTGPAFSSGYWQPFTSSASFVLPAVDAHYYVYAKFRDNAGNEGGITFDQVDLDSTAPSLDSFWAPALINSRVVSVQLYGVGGASMRLSENNDFSGAAWVPYVSNTTFTVSAAEGAKTIFAQLRDAAGLTSAVRSVNLTYDVTAPDRPGVRIRQGDYTKTSTVDVDISSQSATDILLSQYAPMTDATWQPYASLKSFTFTGSDGLKTVYVKVRDGAGNYSLPGSATTTLDRAVPTLAPTALRINGFTSSTTNSSFVTLSFSVTGADELQVSEDLGFGGASWVPYTASRAYTLSPGDGSKTVYARFRDYAGNLAGPASAAVQLDTKAPSAPFIAAAAAVTNVAAVNVQLSAIDADQMMLSLNPDFSGASWAAYATVKPVPLTGLDGTKVIYAKFRRSASGYETPAVSASVLLDRQGPTNAAAELSGAVTYVTSTQVSLRLSAVDTISGVDTVEISEGSLFFDKDSLSMRSLATYALRTATQNFHPIYVRYRDKAGNYSSTVTLGVVYDVTPPTGTIVVAGGVSSVNSQFVTVALTSPAADVDHILIYNDSGSPTEFSYSPSLVWAIRAIQGVPTTVNVKFVDVAGNQSINYSDVVTYDTAAPTVSSMALQIQTSSSQLTLSWDASYLTSVTGYTWYRHLDGVKTVGGTVGGGVTSVTVPSPLAGEEYSVSAWYSGGQRSALSAPAVENGSFRPTKGVLVIDDDAGAVSVENNLKPALTAAGIAYDSVTVAAGSDGPSSATLAQYQVVVWSSGQGPTAPTLSAYDRDTLKAYLTAGGNLIYLGSDASDDSDTATFLKRWMHTGRVETDIAGLDRLYVPAGGLLGAATDFAVGPSMSDADAVYGSALSDEFLNAGKPVAVRYPLAAASAPYRGSWIGTPTAGLYQRKVFTFTTQSIDIPVTGATLVTSGGVALQKLDNAAAKVQLPFAFKFGGVTTDTVWVSSNGLVAFQQAITATPYPLFPTAPSAQYPASFIAPYWVDMKPGGKMYYENRITEVTFVWSMRPVTNYTAMPTTQSTFVTSALTLRSDNQFIMQQDSTYTQYIGQMPNINIAFEDELGAGLESQRSTNDGCCDHDTLAIKAYNYRDTITETSSWLRALVRWTAAPAGVRRSASRSFTVASNVSGAAWMRVSTDGGLDTEPLVAYNALLPITSFGSGDCAKTVQVVYFDYAGNQTGIYTDTQTLDTDVPRIASVFLIDPSTGSNAFTRNRTVTLQILGTATTSDYMRTSESPAFVNAGWVPYVESSTFTLSEGDGAKHVYVWLKDANGNISSPGEGSIALDVVSPSTQAVGDEVASAAPFYINTSYLASDDTITWADLPAGSDTGAQNSFFQTVTLDWSFPFYGQGQSQLIIWPDGFLTLGSLDVSSDKPFPGDKGDKQYTHEQVFQAWEMIAPLYVDAIQYTSASHGIFMTKTADWVMVRWSGEDARTLEDINAAVLLFKDGRIKFVYGDGNIDTDGLVGVSKGDYANMTHLAYNGDSVLSNVTTVILTPNPHEDAKVKLYYRFRYPTGAGAWTDSGVQAASVYDALTFYPPLGAGTYEFYTVGIDEAGNVENAPSSADLSVLFDDAKPLPPSELSAEAEEDSVYVQWTPSTSPDVVAYKVYYGTDLSLEGTDASEGDSPIEIAATDHTKLSNLEPGVETYVVVTAVDHVGNESPRPSGASFLLPHSVRQLASVNTGAFSEMAVIDTSLLAFGGSAGLVWFDMRDPAVPTVVTQAQGGMFVGDHLVASDGLVFTGDKKYDVSDYGMVLAGFNFVSGDYMTPVTPFTMVWADYSSGASFAATKYDGTLVKSVPGNPEGLVAERNAAFNVASTSGPCFGFCYPWLHAYKLDGIGNPTLLGPKLTLPFYPDSMALQSDLLAVSSGQYYNGQYELIDVADPNVPTTVTTASNVRGSFLSWAVDRLVSAGGKILQLHDTGDTASPSIEAATALSGTVNGFQLLSNVGIVSTSVGLDLFEFGELLPSRVRTLAEPLDNNAQSIAVNRSYAFVADGSKLSVYRIGSLGSGTMDLAATYAPFSATEVLLAGQYLFATEGHDLYVLDVSNPLQPLLVSKLLSSDSGNQCYSCSGWHNSMVVLGTKLYTLGEVYDISDPSNPSLALPSFNDMFRVIRSTGEYLVGVRSSTPGTVNVFKAQSDGTPVPIGAYAVTNPVDVTIDGHNVYVLQSNMGGMCCYTAWYKLTVVDASNPAAPYVVATYQLPELMSQSWGMGLMTAYRGFLYMVMRNSANMRAVIVQVDMRDRLAPNLTLEIQAEDQQMFTMPIVVTPDNYLLAAGDREIDVFHVTPNVPVRESMHPDTVGAQKTVIGDRYVYFATNNKLLQVERRAPALKLSLVGTGEVAFSKKGTLLQLYDPPGVPAASLTTDGTGRFDLNDTRYDTSGELCTALTNTGRLTCTLGIPSNVPASELVDAYGVRVKTTHTASLRAQKVRKILSLAPNAKINQLVFSNHRLFAAVSEEPNTGASVEGLYVIDPTNLTPNYHNMTVVGGFNAYSLAVRDSWVFVGTHGAVKAYEWVTRTTKSGFSTDPNWDVRLMTLVHDKLYFIDHGGTADILRCGSNAFGGNLIDCGYFRSGPQVKAIFSPGANQIALGTTTSTNLYIDTGTAFTDNGWIDAVGDKFAYVNGTMLVADGSDLSFYDLSETPIVNLVRRKFQVGGTVRDFAVAGDVLSIADDTGGGLIYRLK